MEAEQRIVIVDDNPDDRALTRRELERAFEGAQIIEVATPGALAEVMNADDFDVLVTDYQLNWSNGLAVLRETKARYPDIPVIMFTNTGTQELAVDAIKSGLDDYVVKSPHNFVRLSASIRLVLDKASQRSARERAEARYRDLFNAVPIGLFRVSPDGQVLEANPALVQLMGYPTYEALLATPVAEFAAEREEGRRLLGLLASERAVRGYELRLRRSDGQTIWVQADAQAVRDNAGRLIYYEGSLEDISERRHNQEQLVQERAEAQRLNERLRRANDRLKRAMLETHHRSKNGLQIIAALIDLRSVEASGTLSATAARQLGNSVRALAEVQNLLTEQAKQDEQATTLSARAALMKLLQLLQTAAPDRRFEVDVENVMLSSKQAGSLALVAHELIMNALQHGEGTVYVRFHAQSENGVLEIGEADGPGFSTDFEVERDAGVGLEIAESLVTMDLHGSADYLNRAGGGSRVVVTFPLTTPDGND